MGAGARASDEDEIVEIGGALIERDDEEVYPAGFGCLDYGNGRLHDHAGYDYNYDNNKGEGAESPHRPDGREFSIQRKRYESCWAALSREASYSIGDSTS